MRAIVIKEFGGPEVLAIEERPDPVPTSTQVLIEVKAFGLNHAECYFRSGAWGKCAEITGIECAGTVRADPAGVFAEGVKVVAIVGGMGRSINGSYAELVAVPRSNVASVDTDLPWHELAALPQSYATAWTALAGILELKAGQKIIVRGGTSALGQAAINIARHTGARVIATTRRKERRALLLELGADEALVDGGHLAQAIGNAHAPGVDNVLEIVGNSTLLDSLAAVKRGGSVCQVGFLGGGTPLTIDPVFDFPAGRHLTAFASALSTGSPEFPISEIPFHEIVSRAAAGIYKAKPARVFGLEQIAEAHRLMESGEAQGKLVVSLA